MRNFRSHEKKSIRFKKGINVIYGRNASGKTNLLEAIHYATLTKSFLNVSDLDCLHFKSDSFEIETNFESDVSIDKTTRVFFSKEDRKVFFLNGYKIPKLSQVVGEFPCVVYSPFDVDIIYGYPEVRRKTIDGILSQSNKAYLQNLLMFRRVLYQRNKVLFLLSQERKISPQLEEQLEIWTESFCKISSYIIRQRVSFVEIYSDILSSIYKSYISFTEEPSIEYQGSIDVRKDDSEKDILQKMKFSLNYKREDEIRRKLTLLGPHRDDIKLKIDHIQIKKFSSQGQAKTFVIGMKIALRKFLYEKLSETPILLIDDALDQLDNHRIKDMINLIGNDGQIITTTTNKDVLETYQVNLCSI